MAGPGSAELQLGNLALPANLSDGTSARKTYDREGDPRKRTRVIRFSPA